MISVMHDSRNPYYRQPFGARPAGEEVCLALDIRGARPEKVLLRVWSGSEQTVDMTAANVSEEKISYKAQLRLSDKPGLVWYYFIIRLKERTLYYGNNPEKTGGRGKLYAEEPPGYQITVYQPQEMPEWLDGGLIYQIFPDRFFNPYKKPLSVKPDSLFHDSWNRAPLYARDQQTGEILAYDFYGGNLDGITAKLDYLEDFGVRIIYLNPIFQSVSNHRFDTGDYEKVDPVLGDMAAFNRLCREAGKRGMKVLLDGVFSHTGSDSRYFNKEGAYKESGAFQSPQSPYYSWYRFTNYPDEYESWWGIGNLPNVNELDEGYLDYIVENRRSITARWLEAGAVGWRLDVADELPLEFIRRMKKRLKELAKNSFLLGEVWEDASHKVAYGELRNYFSGDLLDSAMNYPFRQSVLDFLMARKSSRKVMGDLYSLYENYPRPNFDALMNLLGTHDTVRLLTELAGVLSAGLTDAQKRKYRLSRTQKELALQRLRQAVIWQMTFAGLPAVYYGDEAGLEGWADPFNRGAYPWGREDETAYKYYWKFSRLRRRYPVLQTGRWKPLMSEPDVVAYTRWRGKDAAVIAINRSGQEKLFTTGAATVMVDVLNGETLVPKEGRIAAKVPAGGAIILQNTVCYPDRVRRTGVLLHPSSLPSDYGIGDIGKSCLDFVDFLADSGHLLWQVLPLGPADDGGSPYAGGSAFAGNALLISPDALCADGLLTQEELGRERAGKDEETKVDFARAAARKERLLRLAYGRFRDKRSEDYAVFCQENKYWLPDYSLYMAMKQHFGGRPWQEWPRGLAMRWPEELSQCRELLSEEITYYTFIQYVFWKQWQAIRDRAREKNVTIIGDVPFYVAADSVDTWAHRNIFQLDRNGRPLSVAGVPPDYFSTTGQLWGNPLYDWASCRAEKYKWWKLRLKQGLKSGDILRLDHFRALDSYWSIPSGSETAMYGKWQKGPGADFLLAMQKYFNGLPFIAEDLGDITPDINRLRDRFTLPGMDVLQFCLPSDQDKVLYTGTHDNDTLLGWCEKERTAEVFQQLAAAAGIPAMLPLEKVIQYILEYAYTNDAIWLILPLQDILRLGSGARMNVPGTAAGNWSWRLQPGQLGKQTVEDMRGLARLGGRI